MAIRVQNGAVLNFGILAATTSITAVRIQKAGANPATKRLAAAVEVPASRQLQLPIGALDVVYPSGELGNSHMDALVRAYWEDETFQVDAMTGASGNEAVVATSGYQQATSDSWTFASEND